VTIGETLLRHEPKQAQSAFERAVAIDPAYAPAWDALLRGAREAGALDRVADYIEQRVVHTEAPRLRAELLVELADARAALGDRSAAEAAEEDAVVVDPGNEIAAARVLPRYVVAERWAEALPLAERLVNAAVRDGDGDRAYAHRRTLTRVAMALEDAPRALSAALAAHEGRPTAEAAADVVRVCHRARADQALLTRARPALDVIMATRDELPPECLAELGEVAVTVGSADAATALFRHALAGDPCCTPALVGLTHLAQTPEASAEAAELTIRAASHVDDRAERFRLLVKAGELLAFGAKDLATAAGAFEEARALVPRDHRVLHTLVWIYCELGEWNFLSEILRSIADSEPEPVRRAKGTYAMALVLRDKVGDLARAAAAFEQVLDLDPTRLEAFERLVRVHTERRDWPRLAKAYERMILRTPAEGEEDRKHALLFQLGLVYRDRLGDVPRAVPVFRAALQVKPGDPTTRKALVELLVIAEQTTDAVDVLRGSIALRPEDPDACAELCEVAMRLHDYDRAWRALDAARVLGKTLTEGEERFHRDYDVVPLTVARAALTPEGWKRLIHPKIDPHLTAILACATHAVLRTPRVRGAREQAAKGLGAPLQRAGDAHRVVAAVRRGAQLLGTEIPSLYDCKTATPLEVIPNAPGMLVSLERCNALGEAPLAFLIGKHLAATAPELLAASVFPTIPELAALLAAALHALEPTPAPEAEAGPFDRVVREALRPEELHHLRSLALGARAKGSRFDVIQWKRYADASAARVGLLLAGGLDGARRAMHATPQVAGGMPPKDLLGELVVLAMGETIGALRTALGVAVQA
jgi:tetratricopeptide (TPR) repeat protein